MHIAPRPWPQPGVYAFGAVKEGVLNALHLFKTTRALAEDEF